VEIFQAAGRVFDNLAGLTACIPTGPYYKGKKLPFQQISHRF